MKTGNHSRTSCWMYQNYRHKKSYAGQESILVKKRLGSGAKTFYKERMEKGKLNEYILYW